MPPRPSEITTEAPGRVIADRFELREVLGRGGMATVWSAHDRRLDRQVAIKILRPDLPAADAMRIEREARAAARIADRRVVTVLDLDHMPDGTPFLVMEAHGGHTLADDLRRGPLPADRAALLVDDLAGALAAAHAEGVLHRDIKPANVLSDPDGFRLTDFGIASIDDDLETSGDLVGTLAYIAPERFDGGGATTRSDVFSLGVVLHEAISGRQPFRGTSPADTMHRIRLGIAPALPSSTPPVLASIIKRALSADPSLRPADGVAFRSALDPAVDQPTEPIAVHDPTEVIDNTAVLASAARPDAATQAPAPAPRRVAPEPASPLISEAADRARDASEVVRDRTRRQADRFALLARENPPAAIAVVAAVVVSLLVLLAIAGVGGGQSSPAETPATADTPGEQLDLDLQRIEELGR